MKARSVRHDLATVSLLFVLGIPAVGGPPPPSAIADRSSVVSSGREFSLAEPAPSGRPVVAGFSLAAGAAREETKAGAAKPASIGMPKNWRRAMLELGGFLTYSTVRYWLEYHTWIEDWQYELTCEDQFRRFLTTEAIRFDSNAYVVNWTHALAGALYYELSRTNNLTWAESLAVTFGASLFYEYVSEWREVISVNDMIVTTSGGYTMGEPFFQLSSYFSHQKSPVRRFLGWMNPFLKFNKWLDRKKPGAQVYSDPGWHDFVLSAGWRRTSGAGRGALDTGFVGLETQIILIPEYGRPGTVRRTLRDTSLSELTLDVALGQRPPGEEHLRTGLDEEINFSTRVVGLALFRQKIDELGRGYALSIGLGSALTYVRKRPTLYDSRSVLARLDPPPATPTDFRDKMTVAHLAGPVVDWTRFSRGLKIRAVADAYLDFAMMNAYAFNAYSAVHAVEGLKTTLSYYGYHYALGGSVSGRVDLDWRNLSLRGLVSAHVWNSVEGLDRFQADLLDDSNVVDTRIRYLLKAGWRVPKVPLRAFFALEGIHRWGKMSDIEAGGQETRLFAGLAYLF